MISEKKNIVIHCFCGISRSVTLILAYLIKYCEFNLIKAISHIRNINPLANPNVGFIHQLIYYDVLWNKKTTITPWFYIDMSYSEYQNFIIKMSSLNYYFMKIKSVISINDLLNILLDPIQFANCRYI